MLKKTRLGLLSIAIISSAQAQSSSRNAPSPPTVKMAVRNWRGITLSLGSPILVHYSIAAPQDQEVAVDLGTNSEGWLGLSLTDPSGSTVKELPATNRIRLNDWYHRSFLPSYAYLNPTQSREGDLLVNEYFPISQPGTYHLEVKINLRYLSLGTTHSEPDINRIRSTATTVARTESFDFVVDDAQPSHTRAIASRLLDTINATEDPCDRIELINALFLLPKRVAGPIWQIATSALASDPSNSSDNWMYFADALARLGDDLGVDLLVSMLTPPPGVAHVSKDRENYVLTRLGDLYDGKNGALRRHIDTALEQAGITDRPISTM